MKWKNFEGVSGKKKRASPTKLGIKVSDIWMVGFRETFRTKKWTRKAKRDLDRYIEDNFSNASLGRDCRERSY